MRVILVTGEIPPHPGGIGNYTAQLARKLAETGLNTTVLAVDSPLDSTLERDPGYNLVRLSKPWGRTANNWIRKLAGLDECTWVHVQYQTGAFNMNPGINLAARGWQKRGLRVAWTYHDLLPPYLFPKIGKRARDWVTLRPARFSQAVISTNPGDCARLQAAGFPAWEIPIPSLLPVNTSTAKELSAIRKSYGVPSEDLLLGHVGLALAWQGRTDLGGIFARVAPPWGNPHSCCLSAGLQTEEIKAIQAFVPACCDRSRCPVCRTTSLGPGIWITPKLVQP